MSVRTIEVAIIGAGIVGAACARACSEAGLSTCIIDPRPVGSGATAAGMGHVVVMDDSDAQFALCHRSQQLWDELEQQLPPDCEFQRSGTLWVAADDEEMAEVHRKHGYYAERGVKTNVLDAAAVAEAEPHLRQGMAGGLQVPGDSVVYPPCVARWLIDAAIRKGASLLSDRAVKSFGGTTLELRDGSRVSAGAFIHATGHSCCQLVPQLNVRPKKGHLIITDRYPRFVHHQIVELGYLKSAHGHASESVAFNVQPRKTGQLLIGSSRQYDVESPDVDHQVLRRMVDRAVKYMPELAQLSAIRVWTGIRAATPDSLPIIGPMPDHPGHYLATGHEGLGITTSLATAELIVDYLLGRPSAIEREPYLPSRFAEVSAHA